MENWLFSGWTYLWILVLCFETPEISRSTRTQKTLIDYGSWFWNYPHDLRANMHLLLQFLIAQWDSFFQNTWNFIQLNCQCCKNWILAILFHDKGPVKPISKICKIFFCLDAILGWHEPPRTSRTGPACRMCDCLVCSIQDWQYWMEYGFLKRTIRQWQSLLSVM